MSERKTWLQEEDRILRLLVEERKVPGWAQIARIMAEQFNIQGRSGKQCRQRYHNHLDTRIKHGPWSRQQEHLLVDLQNSFGNRWAQIARAIAGRSQNTVKNKYFSIVRKGVRVLNMAIRRHLKKYKQLDMTTVREIVDTYDPTVPSSNQSPENLSCGQIKRRLLFYSLRDQNMPLGNQDYADIKKLIDSIRNYRKRLNGGSNKMENSQMSMEESVSREREDKGSSVEQWQMKKYEEGRSYEYRDDYQEDSEERQDRTKVNNCILELNKISLKSFNLEALPEAVQEEFQDKDMVGKEPVLSKNFSSFSNKSNLSLFSFKQGDDFRPSELLRKDGTLRSFELPEMDHHRSPFMMIDSPYFDQPRSSFNSWTGYHS